MDYRRIAFKKSKKLPLLCGLFFLLFIGISIFSPVQIASAAAQSAVCVMEVDSRRILYAERADVRLPMASTTKILTAATVLEEVADIEQEIIIPKEAVGIEGSSVYLQEGDRYTVKDLLYGMMLRSGNDAATALALYTQGNLANFCAKMNQTAQKAGALHSRFENPHGLPHKNHYTTATDLSLITCYAMENPTFRQIVATKYYESKNWKNKNKMLFEYDGGIGVKTGYTKEAGRCLVSAAKRGEMTLVCTLLNCYDHYGRTKRLFDDLFAAYHMTTIATPEDTFDVAVGNKTVRAHLLQTLSYPLSDGEEGHLTTKVFGYEKEKANGEVGQIEITLAKRLIFSKKLYKL